MQVRNDTVDAAFAVKDGTPAPDDMLWLPTLDNLFDQIQSAIDRSATSISVRYNLTYGYPLSINIDYDEKIADEELYVTASGLEILATEAEDVDPLPQIIEKQSSKSAQNPDISGCYLVGVRTTGAFALAAFCFVAMMIYNLEVGIVFLAISLFWINYTGYWIKMGDIQISGPLWAVLGFLIGLIFSTKKHSENRF